MKKIGIMQPYLFPYIGYFQLIKAVDEYIIYDDVQFIKGGWINRNNLLIGGQKRLFTLPLADASANKLINQIHLQDDFGKFKSTLAQSYARAPYKAAVLELVDAIFAYPDKNLGRFLGNSLIEIITYLNLDTKLTYSSSLDKNTELRAQAKILHICKLLGGTDYINAIGGQALYRKADFAAQDLSLHFLKTHFVPYRQFANDFIAGLSILDILMFNSPDEVNPMLDNYELV